MPIWIEGFDHVMHESRKFPRFIPRGGKDVGLTFGEAVDTEVAFGDLRQRWRGLVERERQRERSRGKERGVDIGNELVENEMGALSGGLRNGEEAVRLREECVMRVRKCVLDVRRTRGLPDEDPKVGMMETWKEEGAGGKREGRMEDGSWVSDT